MQQLTLFTSSRTGGKTSKRRTRSTQPTGVAWDLWTQETEKEKEMALFFLDIRDFTPFVEKHQATDVIHIVKKLFSTFQNIIRVYHGRIIETSGDGFYAAFGFDRDIKEAVNAAVQAGMAILNTLENLNVHTFERNIGRRIDIGIGVHVGKVAVGNLRLGAMDHFVVMGYPVNVASRLQAATKELNNNFIVSSNVFKMLNDSPADRQPIHASLKGVADPFELHLIGKAYAA
jgi:adenylate cyclase